jgi:uncharacterized membrane protein YfcA
VRGAVVAGAAGGLPRLSTPVWGLVVVAMAVGAGIGKALAERVPEQRARWLVLLLALGGGISTLGKGLWGL